MAKHVVGLKLNYHSKCEYGINSYGNGNFDFSIPRYCKEKAMAPHSSTLAWEIPWIEEPGRLHPWGRWGSDTTERLPFHFSLSCIGEGNGNPLQYSCLENPRDGGSWWAAVCGVAQSRTRLKRLSSSSYCKGQVIVFWYNKVKPPFLLWIHLVHISHWFIGFISKSLLVPIAKERILFFRLSPESKC